MNFPNLNLPRWQKRAPEPAGTIPLSLVRSAQAASWIAYFCLVYLLWLYTLDIARDRAAPLFLTHVGGWVGEVRFWFPYIVGFAVIAVGIPYVAKIAIPIFMSLDWRTNAWPKAWSLFIAMAVSLVVFAGTFTIQGDTILEKGRDAAVAVEQVQMGRAMIDGQIAAKEAELKSMMENRNAYLAQAASVGAAEWERSYIAKTPASDPQRDRIVRALGAARAADAVRGELLTLRQQKARGGAVAAVSERVEARQGQQWIAATMDWIQGARAILLSLVMDIVALLMPWIALRLEQARARQLGDAPADADMMMIEDHSAEAVPQEIQPMKPAEKREQYFDEEGNKIVRRKATWAKVPTKKSGRKEVDLKTGKKVVDKTDYEIGSPPDKTRLNGVYEDDRSGADVRGVSGGGDGGDIGDAGDPSMAESADRSLPELAEEADDVVGHADEVGQPRADVGDEQPPEDPTLEHAEAAAVVTAEEPAPLILADEEVDRLIDKGVLVEDDDGVITAVSQEDQSSIEQPDQTYNYPRLPAPRETEEAA